MTIKEAEEFYNNDKQQYILTNRPGFVNWFNKVYDDTNINLSIEQLQELVDKIIMWYVFKYPNRLLDKGTLDMHFTKIKDISNEMEFKQLLYRLNHSELETFECKYRTSGWHAHDNKIYFRINLTKDGEKVWNFFITENGNLSYDTQV